MASAAEVDVVVASIVSDADPYVHEVVKALTARGLRAEADVRNEKINYKVREHSLAKVPVILNSRADGRMSRLASCAVAALNQAYISGNLQPGKPTH